MIWQQDIQDAIFKHPTVTLCTTVQTAWHINLDKF
jgi:hypothetical protein